MIAIGKYLHYGTNIYVDLDSHKPTLILLEILINLEITCVQRTVYYE